jgi:N4-bis(aminopropyl)spermidine synthase
MPMLDRTQLQILLALPQRGATSWARLVDAQDASLPEFHAALEALQAQGRIVTGAEGFRLTPEGGRVIAALSEAPPLALQCADCQGKGYVITAEDARLRRLEQVLSGRPSPNLDYDQGAITPADSLLRAAFMEERGDLCGARILFVGDFDLMSVALALTGRPARVVVLEIDQRVVGFINEVAHREDLRLEARPFDVRDPFPESLSKQFDVFLCDPVETLAGIRLYLSRGCAALVGEGAAAYIGLTTLEASRRKWYDVQAVMYDMGFAITDIRRRFSGYPDHDEAPTCSVHTYPIIQRMAGQEIGHRWYTSAFVRAEAVRDPEPIVTGQAELGEELYVDDEAWATPRRI